MNDFLNRPYFRADIHGPTLMRIFIHRQWWSTKLLITPDPAPATINGVMPAKLVNDSAGVAGDAGVNASVIRKTTYT
jgi:hypothetical protein